MTTDTKHGTPTHRDIAIAGLHGVTTGADDRDEMGVCIEPPEYA